MPAFQLPRTGLPDLEFSGECLVHLDGAEVTDTTGGRQHELSIYKADDGEYVAAVSYRSPHPSEVQDDYVEAADTVAEVDEILSLYDPTERVDSRLFEGEECARQQRIKHSLLRHYDQQVAKALKALSPGETVES